MLQNNQFTSKISKTQDFVVNECTKIVLAYQPHHCWV